MSGEASEEGSAEASDLGRDGTDVGAVHADGDGAEPDETEPGDFQDS